MEQIFQESQTKEISHKIVSKGCFTDLRNFMRKIFELFDDYSKIKTSCF